MFLTGAISYIQIQFKLKSILYLKQNVCNSFSSSNFVFVFFPRNVLRALGDDCIII